LSGALVDVFDLAQYAAFSAVRVVGDPYVPGGALRGYLV
jgi:hypothetical protein